MAAYNIGFAARLAGHWSNGHFIAVVLHLGWTYIVGLLFVNLYFYIFNQQRFRADTATIPALQQALPVGRHYNRPRVIHFKLKDFSKIVPIGQEPNLRLSWYWLTDGDLWLTFGNHTLYEYSKEAIEHFGNRQTPYSDYYLVRFLEDFTELFEKVSVSIPDHLYKLTENIQQFWVHTQKWYEIYDIDEDEYSDFYYEEYDKILSWRNERTFDSMHLIGGPTLSFFRNRDKIRIVWETEHILENGINLWTAKDGSCEMDFSDFVKQVKIFGEKFFNEMDKQIELTLAKDWGDIEVNKAKLVEEHRDRKLEFDKNLYFLEYGADDKTSWTEIENLYNRMVEETK